MTEGRLIVLEGGEGAGKTTQSTLLAEHLRTSGYEVVHTREPGGTPFGEEIRSKYLLSRTYDIDPLSELFLFLASRAQHVEQVIKPALKKNKIVVCDRQTWSSVAYQGFGRDLVIGDVVRCCEIAMNRLRPDLIFYLDVPLDVGQTRTWSKQKKMKLNPDTFEDLDQSFHQKVRKGFEFCYERVVGNPRYMIRIDAADSESIVASSIKHYVKTVLQLG